MVVPRPYDFNYRKNFPVMSEADFENAIKMRDEAKLQNGEGERNYTKAINSIIEGNLALAINRAKIYSRRYNVSIEDAISIGAIALKTAAERYDPLREVKFSTYAVRCIKSQLIGELPYYAKTPVIINSAKRRILKSLHEIINYRDSSEPKEIEELAKKIGTKPLKVIRLMQAESSTGLYLDNFFPDRKRHYSDTIDSGYDTPYEITERRELEQTLKYKLHEALKSLRERESTVIIMRFGFTGNEFTLQEVGKVIGVCRERVRQIEEKACKKLGKKLNGFLEEYFLEK